MKTINDKRPYKMAAIFFIVLCIGIASCTKPEQEIGLGLQPTDNLLGVGTVDTFTVVTYTLKDDSIRSDKVNPGLVGVYFDPVFGLAKAGHVTEIRLQTAASNPVFASPGTTVQDLVVDSVVLVLGYNPTIGNNPNSSVFGKKGELYFEVFEIADSLSLDSAYYNSRIPKINSEDLIKSGHNLVAPRPTDSVVVGGVKIPAQIRIPLQESFADRFINFNDGQGLSPTDFLNLIKGIYITVDETKTFAQRSGIIYFDTFNRTSKITMYLRNTALADSIAKFEYDFEIRGSTGKYNVLEHNRQFAAFPLFEQLENDNRSLGQTDLYLQAMAGTKIRVELPHINELRKLGNRAVNQAVLVLPVREGSIKNLAVPGEVFVLGLDAEGRAFLIDDQLDGGNFVDGIYNPATGEYRLKLSRFMQQIMLGDREFYGLEIVSARAAFSANRAIINGPEYDPLSNAKNCRLAMTFTQF